MIVSLSIYPQDGGSESFNMLTTIYQFAGHHIPEDLYLHGVFTTVLGQLPTIMYIPFLKLLPCCKCNLFLFG